MVYEYWLVLPYKDYKDKAFWLSSTIGKLFAQKNRLHDLENGRFSISSKYINIIKNLTGMNSLKLIGFNETSIADKNIKYILKSIDVELKRLESVFDNQVILKLLLEIDLHHREAVDKKVGEIIEISTGTKFDILSTVRSYITSDLIKNLDNLDLKQLISYKNKNNESFPFNNPNTLLLFSWNDIIKFTAGMINSTVIESDVKSKWEYYRTNMTIANFVKMYPAVSVSGNLKLNYFSKSLLGISENDLQNMTSLSVIENKILTKNTINDAKWATGYEEISNMSIHDLEMLVKHFNMKLFYTPYKEIKGNSSNNVADLLVNYHSVNKSFVVDIIKQRMGNMSDFTRNSQYFENILTTFSIYRFTKTLEATWNNDDDTRVVLGNIYNGKKMNNEQKQPLEVFNKKRCF